MGDTGLLDDDVGPGEEPPGFDIDNPVLPPDTEAEALQSGGYPYDARMKHKDYRAQVEPLQVELVKLQRWVERQSQRIVILFEGGDAAGKGGTINKFMQHLNSSTGSSCRMRRQRRECTSGECDRRHGEEASD